MQNRSSAIGVVFTDCSAVHGQPYVRYPTNIQLHPTFSDTLALVLRRELGRRRRLLPVVLGYRHGKSSAQLYGTANRHDLLCGAIAKDKLSRLDFRFYSGLR
jgi:hypothetical protein